MADAHMRGSYPCSCGKKYKSELASEMCKNRGHVEIGAYEVPVEALSIKETPIEMKVDPTSKNIGKCLDCGIEIIKTGQRGVMSKRCLVCKKKRLRVYQNKQVKKRIEDKKRRENRFEKIKSNVELFRNVSEALIKHDPWREIISIAAFRCALCNGESYDKHPVVDSQDHKIECPYYKLRILDKDYK